MRVVRSRAADDRGSALLFAVSIIALVGVLGTVVLANGRGDLRRVERSADRAEAVALLDIGVAEAWSGIVGGRTAAFRDSGTLATGTWSFEATPVDENRWTVRATGGDGVDEANASVTVARDYAHPYTLLVDEITAGPLAGRVDGRVGIFGDATFSGRSLGTVQELIGPDAACTGCSNPLVVDSPLPRPEIALEPDPLPCPASAGVISGAIGSGTYRCAGIDVVTFAGAVTVDGPVVIEFGTDVSVDLSDAVINGGGGASDLAIVQPDPGEASIAADGARFSGLLVASTTPFAVGDLTWTGAIEVESFTPAAGARLQGSWDTSVGDLGAGAWVVQAWDVLAG